jgi:hypothetical protein
MLSSVVKTPENRDELFEYRMMSELNQCFQTYCCMNYPRPSSFLEESGISMEELYRLMLNNRDFQNLIDYMWFANIYEDAAVKNFLLQLIRLNNAGMRVFVGDAVLDADGDKIKKKILIHVESKGSKWSPGDVQTINIVVLHRECDLEVRTYVFMNTVEDEVVIWHAHSVFHSLNETGECVSQVDDIVKRCAADSPSHILAFSEKHAKRIKDEKATFDKMQKDDESGKDWSSNDLKVMLGF